MSTAFPRLGAMGQYMAVKPLESGQPGTSGTAARNRRIRWCSWARGMLPRLPSAVLRTLY
jgi:hypothetical protein